MASKNTKKVYVCGTAWHWEMGETDVMCYPSVKHLKKCHECTDECGIVELEVTKVRYIKKPVEHTQEYLSNLPKTKKMRDERLLEKALQESAKKSPDERANDMISRGVVDKNGKVLLGKKRK